MAVEIVDRRYCRLRDAVDEVNEWLVDLGHDPNDVGHVLVDTDAPPRVWIYERDANGHRYLNGTGDEVAGHYVDVPADAAPIPVALPWPA